MENALTEFGTTLALGGFFILSLVLITVILRFSNLLPFLFYKEWFNPQRLLAFGTIPLLILCYVFGMLLEDSSEPAFSGSLKLLFPKENNIRADAFYERFASEYAKNGFIKDLTNLADDPSKFRKVNDWIINNQDIKSPNPDDYSPDFTENEFIQGDLSEEDLCRKIINDTYDMVSQGNEVIHARVPRQGGKMPNGFSEFYKGEFDKPYTINILFNSILSDGNFWELSIKIKKTRIDQRFSREKERDTEKIECLNKLLKRVDLYKIVPEKNIDLLPAELVTFAIKTDESGKKKYNELKTEEKNRIMRLNRLILENIYNKETPKSLTIHRLNNFLSIQGKITSTFLLP